MAEFSHLLVIGVGLIGGSFAAAVKRAGLADRVSGIAPAESLDEALALGLVDDGVAMAPSESGAWDTSTGTSTDAGLDALIASADLIMLAAPVMRIPQWLQRIAPHLSPRAIVTDCASTKQSVLAAARRHLGAHAVRFVAGHPIAGSERSGAGAARAELFKSARLILCPAPDTDAAALARVRALWTALGAQVSELDPQRHDRLYAAVSHWPHALVFALTGALAKSDVAQDAVQAAGAGLRDTTRIGASSPSLWAEIVLDNREQVLQAAQAFQLELDAMLAALRAGDRAALEAAFAPAAEWRRRIP